MLGLSYVCKHKANCLYVFVTDGVVWNWTEMLTNKFQVNSAVLHNFVLSLFISQFPYRLSNHTFNFGS